MCKMPIKNIKIKGKKEAKIPLINANRITVDVSSVFKGGSLLRFLSNQTEKKNNAKIKRNSLHFTNSKSVSSLTANYIAHVMCGALFSKLNSIRRWMKEKKIKRIKTNNKFEEEKQKIAWKFVKCNKRNSKLTKNTGNKT